LLAEAARGATVFLSTRLLDVAERISDQIGIIDEGNLVAAGTPDQIRSARTRSAHLLDVFQRMAQTSMTRSGRNAACSPLLA
jgi:ABC-2 type transport system ATP-binding protein